MLTAHQHSHRELEPGHALVVALRDVVAGYGDQVALHDVSLAVPAGSLIAVVGPNGAGKSTLLKVIAGLLRPWRGTVDVLGRPPGAEARRVGYVPPAELVHWGLSVSGPPVVGLGRHPP